MKSVSLALIVEAGTRRLVRLIAAVAVVSAACGGRSPSAPTPPTPTPSPSDLTGTFSGNVLDSIGPGIWHWHLTQSGANVSGTVTGGGPLGTVRGDVSGTRLGTTLTFTIVVLQGGLSALPTCAQNMTGSATGVTATRISGTYSGTTTCTGGFNPGPLNNGQFTLMKQQSTPITSDSSAVDGHPREFSERDVLAITERQGGAKKGVLVGLGVGAISGSVLGVASQNYRFFTTGEATT